MERLEREIERVSRQYSRVFKGSSGAADRNDWRRTSEENERQVKKIIISYSVLFMQNNLSFKPKDVYDMETDDLLMIYEIVIQQIEEQRKSLDGVI